MGKRVPKHISQEYDGGASEFRREKRRDASIALRALKGLQRGCAYFPCGSKPVTEAIDLLNSITKAISTRNWGK